MFKCTQISLIVRAKYEKEEHIMDYTTRSILEELTEAARKQDKDALIETSGSNIIQSAINLIERIHRNYEPDTAIDLERRILNSIRSRDSSKFERGFRKIRN